MKLRYDYYDESLTDDLSDNGLSVASDQYAAEFYDRIGGKFPVLWPSGSRAEPIIETDDLPRDVSESDIETALTNMKQDGILETE